ncbi:MAG: thioredoxin [Deltaproteobacteria bacterium]|nr:thioredoxin [Deltaproteobacteria bacterium]
MNPHVKTATDQNFDAEVLQSGTPALVDFWAVWCGPCRALAPIIDELAAENTGKLNVFKLNVDENPDTAGRYGIRGIPTLLFFKGGEIVKQVVGVVPKVELQKTVNSL